MRESQFLVEWTADVRRQGQAEGLRFALLRLAEKRFKGALTDADRKMISTQDSPEMLSEWFNAAVDSEDSAAFRNVLPR